METQNAYPSFDISVPFKGENEPELVTVHELRRSFPPVPDQTQIKAFVAAGLEQPGANLGQSEWLTVVHAAADVLAATKIVSAGHYQPDRGDLATLNLLPIDVKITSLFPLFQPRIAGDPAVVDPPRISGLINQEGDPIACLVFEFEDEDHWRRQVEEQIRGTLNTGADLRVSILNHGVSTPLLAYPAIVRFGDVSIRVMGIADGMTRFVRCWQNLLGAAFKECELPGQVASRLLARKVGQGATTESTSREQGRLDEYLALVANFNAYAEHYDNSDVVRIGQSLIVPAKIAVGFSIHQDALPKEQQFPDAIAAAVAQVHTLQRPWRSSAVDANVIAQSIQRAATDGYISVADVGLATGESGIDTLSEPWVEAVKDHPEIDEGLVRAVWLIYRLTRPDAMKAVNRNIRALRGIARVTKNIYAATILSIIDRPWRASKEVSRGNAASAWKAGGPVPHEVYGSTRSWRPLLGDKFATLVPAALNPEDPDHWSALYTLEIAGGIALVADGLILAASGSTAVDSGFKRVQPQVLVSRLATTEAGLYVLAHAADSFHSDRQASNSLTPDQRKKLISNPGPKPYPVCRPDESDPIRAVADPSFGFSQIRTIADPEADGGDNKPKPTPLPPAEVFKKNQTQLEDSYRANGSALRGIIEAAASDPGIYAGADSEIWSALEDQAKVNWRHTDDIKKAIGDSQLDQSIEDPDDFPEDDSEVLP